jgi:hypothetical protein
MMEKVASGQVLSNSRLFNRLGRLNTTSFRRLAATALRLMCRLESISTMLPHGLLRLLQKLLSMKLAGHPKRFQKQDFDS